MNYLNKTHIALWGLLISCMAFSQNPTETENYIYVQEPTGPVNTVTSATAAIRAVQYFDGLGRPKQTVQIKASPDQTTSNSPKNLVTHYEYDGFGRQVLDFLPVPVLNQTDGQITSDANYNTYKNQQYGSQAYYSEKTLENSPLNRVMSQAAPGQDWAKGAGHEIGFEYLANTVNDAVKIFKVTLTSDYLPALSQNHGNYPAGSLYKITTTDENGHKIHEFKDKQGRVVLKRTSVANGSVAGKNTDVNAELLVAADTYYVYDVYGNLTYVIPPLASAKSSITTTIIASLCYTYRYDERNRLVEKTLPGKGIEYMVYDKQDRLVATQDANLRNDGGKWLFTKYDKFSRVVYTGIYTGGTKTRASVQTTANGAANNNNESRSTSGFTQDGIMVKYTKTAFPTSFPDVLSINYYDYYDSFSPSAFAEQPVRSGTQTADEHNSLKGLPTTTAMRILGTESWEKIHNVYDIKSRPVGMYKQNHLGGSTKTESKLNFRGLPEYTLTNHKRTGTGVEVITRDNFTYDNMERLTKHTQSLGSSPIQHLIAQNQYDKLGQLITKKVGGTTANAADRWQEINYSYNIRGWLTNINDVGVTLLGKDATPPSLGDDLFAFKIQYNSLVNGGSTVTEPLYNGNIAQAFWKTSTDNSQRGYHYTYDQLNRLRKADFYKEGNNNITAYGEYLAYDVNGNILALNRSMGDATDNEIDMDKLVYTYDAGNKNSNRLVKVVDNATTGKSEGFNNGTSGTTNDYTYDANGNIISDRNKGITSISYNFLNLPELIMMGTGRSIAYTYNAAGQKVKKFVVDETTDPETQKMVEYLDGFQYAGEVLQFFPHAEGYVRATPGGLSTPGGPPPSSYIYSYVYNYTDHLGNIRMSYTKDPGTSQLKILEENHYYPFGLKHSVYNTGKMDFKQAAAGGGIEPGDGIPPVLDYVTKTKYDYKYNGKELQDELGLDWYDYQARNYDPALGRWMNVDPLAEVSRRWSPYNYAYNNTLRFIDPDGMQGEDVIIRGNFKQEAFDQLQASVEGQLKLTMDKNGKVEATAVEGAELNEASETLLAATNDENITVNLFTTDEFETASGAAFAGGAFQGSKVNGDGTIDAVNVVNPTILGEIDSFNERGAGVGVLHETIESYVGAQQSPGSPPARTDAGIKGEGVANWEKAHKEAHRIDPRAILSKESRPGLGYTIKGGKTYRNIELRKGTGANRQTKTIVDKKEYKKR